MGEINRAPLDGPSHGSPYPAAGPAPYPAAPAPELSDTSTPSHPRPRIAPGNAEWDLAEYQRRALHYERSARRFTWGAIVLSVATATVGAFTVLADQAVLGIVTGVLGAMTGGVEAARTHFKLPQKAAAYRSGYVEIDNELDRYHNGVGAYGALADDPWDGDSAGALLTDRLAEINLATERSIG